MIRFKRGLAILLSACMIGGMMPLPTSAQESVSGNTVQTESTEQVQENGEAGTGGQDKVNKQPGTEEQSSETEEQQRTEEAQSEDEKSSETDNETGSETMTDAEAEGTAISAVQALIDALPDADSITEDSAEDVTAQLDSIDEAMAELTEEEMSQLDLTRYDAVVAKMMALMGMEGAEQPMGITLTQDSNGFYQINSAADLQEFANLVNSGTKDAKAILAQDIDCSGLSNFTPIGTQENPFAGTFNGNSHAIKNLTINTPNADYVGLFGYIERETNAATGAVYSLGIEGGSFTGNSYVGSVFGYGSNVCIINCYTTATVNGQSYAGVFDGYHTSGGQITCCYAAGTAHDSTKLFTGYIFEIVNNTYEFYCYYLSDETETSMAARPMTSDQFHSGYLIERLNEGQTTISNIVPQMSWGQDISGGNTLPCFDNVKKYQVHKGSVGYLHNYEGSDCTLCNEFMQNKPDQDSDGYYLIDTADKLRWFASYVNGTIQSGNRANARVTADITVSDWNPVGSESRVYQGSFDGGDKTITINSIHAGATEAGLFGYTNGTVKNVRVAGTITTTGNAAGGVAAYNNGTISDCTNTASVTAANTAGGVAAYNNGTISDCTNTASVTAANTAGGVAAYNNGTISDCTNTASVTAANTAGGIIGENEQTSGIVSDSTMVESCTNSGTVTATGAGSYVGGIVGRNDAIVRECTNSSTDISVNSADSYAGGIAGYNSRRIQKCANIAATASTSANYGGVVGYNTLPDNYMTDIEWVNNCYTLHNVFVYYAAGGRITDSYTSGGSFSSTGSGTTYQNCYATSTSASGVEVVTAEKLASGEIAYLLAQKDSIWRQNITVSPKEDSPSFTGAEVFKGQTEDNQDYYHNHIGSGECQYCKEPSTRTIDGKTYYELKTSHDLYWFARMVNADGAGRYINAVLCNDITVNTNVLQRVASGDTGGLLAWTPIGESSDVFYSEVSYFGSFDGCGYTISGLYYNESATNTQKYYYVGLFGMIRGGANGSIRNVTLRDSYFKSNRSSSSVTSVGGICGYNYMGTITNCSSYATVTANEDGAKIGGICGESYSGTIEDSRNYGKVLSGRLSGGICGTVYCDNAKVKNCVNWGDVSKGEFSGGIVGELTSNASIENCANFGSISGSQWAGGLCGFNCATITNSYNAGSPWNIFDYNANGTITNCYYLSDRETDENDGTTYKTEAQFRSGEVAYLLKQNDSTSSWGQNITTGEREFYPSLTGAQVYEHKAADGSYATTPCASGYTNDSTDKTKQHNFEDGICTDCGESDIIRVTVSGITAIDRDYDGTTDVTLDYSKVVITGLQSGDEVSVTADGTFSDKNAGTDKTVNISNLKLTGKDAEKYSLSATGNQTTATATIRTKPVTAILNIASREYNGTTAATVTASVKSADVYSGDSISISGLSGTYESADAGTGKTVTVDQTKKQITGTGSANYSVEIADTATGDIDKKALTVTADNKSITYGDAAPAYTAAYDGFVNGETKDTAEVFGGTLTFACDYVKAGSTDNSKAGTYTITPKGLTSANYEITFKAGTLTVEQADGQVSIASVGNKTYGDADFALSVDKHGSDGALTYTSSNTKVLTVDNNGNVILKNAGIATITVHMAEGTNYKAAENTLTVAVDRKAAKLEVESLAYTAIYGDSDIDLGLTTEGESEVVYTTTDDKIATATGGKLHIVGVGDATIKLSMEQSTNYLAKDVEITVKVNPAALTIIAENKTIEYGTDAPAFTVKYDGFKNGDTADKEGVLSGTLGFDCSYKKGDATNGKAGNYDITPKGLTARNYVITFVKGILTVKEKAPEPSNDSGDSNNTSTNGENTVHTHTYTSAMTKAPTTTEEGIMTYTCTTCGNVFTQPIAKIASATGTSDSSSTGQNSKPSSKNNTGNSKNDSSKNIDSQNNSDAETKPYIKDDSGKEGWDVISSQLDEAKSGETVTVAMNGTTVVPKDIFDSIKGEDVTLVLDMGNGLSWKINGQDITEPSGDIDFGVTVGADAGKSIPVDVINNVTGERYSMNLSLAYDGEFGFTAILTINMESKNAGLYANLFYYNEQTGELEFVSAGQIDSDGNVELEFAHASDYTIVIDAVVMDDGNKDTIDTTKDNGNAEDNTTIPASNADNAKSDAWNPTIIIIIGICILLIVFGAVIFVRKKSGSEEE